MPFPVSVQAHATATAHGMPADTCGPSHTNYQFSSYPPKDALGHSSCHDTLHNPIQLGGVSGREGSCIRAPVGRGEGGGLRDARLGKIPEEPALCTCDTSCLVLKLASCRLYLAISLFVASKKIRRLLRVCSVPTRHPAGRHSDHGLTPAACLSSSFPPVITGGCYIQKVVSA